MSKTFDEIKITQELIKKKSITPKDDGAIKLVASYLSKIGFKCKVLKFKSKDSPEILNLYARIGNKSPNFCFAGHTDVVPVGSTKGWSVNPFAGQIKNGYLYGRGVSDMKGGIGCFIAATHDFLKQNKKFNGSISFLITGDEEGVAINGTKKVVEFLKKKKEKIDFCLIGEPTNPNKLGDMMKIGRRGSFTTHITLIGKQGHIAYPHKAINPITPLIKILGYLKSKPLDRGTKNFQPSNLEVSSINVDNTADNVIPEKAIASFNIRYNDRHNFNSLKTKITSVVKNFSKRFNCKFELKFIGTGTSFLTKPNKKVLSIQKIIKKVTNQKSILSTSGGTSDARFIKDIAPSVEFGLVGNTMHQVNERTSLLELKKLKLIYKKILEDFFI